MTDYTCPECASSETDTYPGEYGYGTVVDCADCGYPLDYTD